MLRKLIGLVLLAVVASAGTCDKPKPVDPDPSDPSQPATPSQAEMTFDIQVTGVTYAGNTNFLDPSTQFTPVEQFSRGGTLLVARQTVEGGPGVGMTIGSVTSPQAGNLWFATQSSMLKVVSAANSANRNAGIVVASVTFNRGAGTVEVKMITGGTGHPVSRTMQLNSFVWRSGLAASKQILDGEMKLQLSDNDRRVTGEAVFFGGAYIEPGTYAIALKFEGTRR